MKSMMCLVIAIFSLNLMAEVRVIVLEGSAEKSLKPDLATFNLSVWGKGGNAKEAQRFEAEESKRLRSVFKKFKLDDENILTSGYSLNPNYIYNQKTNQNDISGYIASETIQINIKNIEEIGNFFDEVSVFKKKESGVNINNLQWDISTREEISNGLLSLAVQNARAKAEILAKANNVKIKNVHKVIPQFMPIERDYMPMGGMLMKSSGGEESTPTNLQSGTVKVRVSVNLEYEIE